MDIQVILTENDPKLGKRGQVIKVSPGYAQNFLFPHKKAKPATAANLKMFDDEKARRSKEEAAHLASAEKLRDRIEAVSLHLAVSAGEGDKLFGSVTSQDVAQALADKGILLDRKMIHLEEPLKKLGSHRIPLKLHPQVHTHLTLELVKRT